MSNIMLRLKATVDKLEAKYIPSGYIICKDSEYKELLEIEKEEDSELYQGMFLMYRCFNIIPRSIAYKEEGEQ